MKNVLRIAMGGLLVAGASLLVIPEDATSFSTIGGSLGLSQRDQRLYDNFNDSTLHNNNTTHPNWPGYTQVEMACWKGGAEWGSIAFGDGSGDTGGSNGTVGSGGGNFDYFWMGEAGGIGNTNNNINSSISGSAGGVLAYTETPISDGWRIRYYNDSFTWQDGPGNVGSGIDFQGVACHEMGHALGLGHTGASGATMRPSISGSGVAQRSINSDDQAGVQFVYGVISGTKPTISSLSGSLMTGGTAVITGTNFTPNNNEVWLNNDGVGSTIVKVTGLASTSGGTQISFTVPAGIQDGGVHVKVDDSGGDALSEGHPFDGTNGPPTMDFIDLDGPTGVLTGVSVTYTISNAPSNSPAWIYYSKQLTGTVINGQQFDIGGNLKTIGIGSTNGAGTYSATSPPVPNRFSGATAYIEGRVDDNGGAGPTLDSNFITLNIF